MIDFQTELRWKWRKSTFLKDISGLLADPFEVIKNSNIFYLRLDKRAHYNLKAQYKYQFKPLKCTFLKISI